ncbi:MAG: PspC domain-containing protein [Chitinophagaceae bacterium]|nr:PspC domain-containing protein [Chitinophagaceae bacterium]MBK9484586.1 PspC domain-containing protein [Chitinophagaceae bacterium]MBL0199175.1 PspC domain-containing protein [Chitinophagaceae bacterium]
MKQVININFQGRVVPIEVTAFELLKNYTESLSRHFANEEGKEEIINDIESRIGELFQERITKGATCITEDDVNAIIKNMGRPEEFEAMDDTQTQSTASSSTSQEQSSAGNTQPTGNKRLFRDENDKVLGGVCSGLANYFNIDVVIVRIIFVVLLFSGIGFLTYIIMWIAVPSSATTQIGGARKKLFRNPDEKLIAGVCSGIGNYFGINAWIPRVLFLLPFLSFISRWGRWGGFLDFGDVVRFTFSPTSLIVYIILWIVIPEAITTSEKLEMKGEKVDMNSIKASVMEEMKGVGKKASTFGKEASSVVSEKASAVAGDVKNFSKRNRGGLGNVIAMIAKIFAYFIIGCVGFALVMALFGLAIASIGLFPLKDFLIGGDYQNLFAWGTLIFFIAVPIIGIITWIIRKIARSKSNSNILGWSFGALWVIGWVCIVLLGASISRDFNYNSKNLTEQDIALNNPTIDKLEITAKSPLYKYNRSRFLRFEPFQGIQEDTAYVNNVDVRIVKATNDSFRITVIKTATGRARNIAEENAARIQYSGVQKDSVLLMDKGIAINKTDKFRNQRVVLTIYVPVGKRIKIDKSISWFNDVHFGNNWDNGDWYYDSDSDAQDWKTGVEYKMGADGQLYTLKGVPAGKEGRTKVTINSNGIEVITDNNNNGDDNYRYNSGEPMNKIDSMKVKLENEKQKIKDSLEKAKEKIEKQLEKIGDNIEPTPLSSQLPAFSPLMEII